MQLSILSPVLASFLVSTDEYASVSVTHLVSMLHYKSKNTADVNRTMWYSVDKKDPVKDLFADCSYACLAKLDHIYYTT